MTFAELIYPIRSEAILGAVATTGSSISKWRRGSSWPQAWQLVPLAPVLRVSVEELAEIIYNDVTGGGQMKLPSLAVAA